MAKIGTWGAVTIITRKSSEHVDACIFVYTREWAYELSQINYLMNIVYLRLVWISVILDGASVQSGWPLLYFEKCFSIYTRIWDSSRWILWFHMVLASSADVLVKFAAHWIPSFVQLGLT